MAALSASQRLALVGLLARCPTPMLARIDAMAGALAGPKALAVRELAAAEVQNRDRRELVLWPLDPLFRPRADGLPGLQFPSELRPRLWSMAIRHEPALLAGLDRGDQISRTIADRLCLSLAMDVRDHPKTIWPEANEAQIEDLAGCLDLMVILRRVLGHMNDWLRGGDADATEALRSAIRQASDIGNRAPLLFLEILFAHTDDARLFLRLLGQLVPLSGRELYVEEAWLDLFCNRLIQAVQARADKVVAFEGRDLETDLPPLRLNLQWISDVLAEFDASSPVRPDATGRQALHKARQDVSHWLSDCFIEAEQTILSLLPVEASVPAGKMKRPLPRLDRDQDHRSVARARMLLGVVAISRGPAAVFGRESERRQTAEGLTWRLATWADEAIERASDDLLPDEDLAFQRVTMVAGLLTLIEAREAGRSIRRRLMALGSRRAHLRPATSAVSPQSVRSARAAS